MNLVELKRLAKLFFFDYGFNWELNRKEKFIFKNTQEASLFFEEVINKWIGVTTIACRAEYKGERKVRKQKKDVWVISFSSPRCCYKCERALEIIKKIYGSLEEFSKLPFVDCGYVRPHVDKEVRYWFRTDLLSVFAETGSWKAVEKEAARIKVGEMETVEQKLARIKSEGVQTTVLYKMFE